MDEDRIIAEVAKRNGVLLQRDDPILQINTMLDLHTADHQEREDQLVRRDADLLAGLVQVIEQAKAQATGQVARAAAAQLPRAMDRLLAQRQRRFRVMTALIAVAAASIVVGGLEYWARPAATICQDVRGGRFCGTWVIPPNDGR